MGRWLDAAEQWYWGEEWSNRKALVLGAVGWVFLVLCMIRAW